MAPGMDLGNLQKSLLLAQRASQAIDSAAGLSAEDKTAIAIAVTEAMAAEGAKAEGPASAGPCPAAAAAAAQSAECVRDGSAAQPARLQRLEANSTERVSRFRHSDRCLGFPPLSGLPAARAHTPCSQLRTFC